MTWAPNLPRGVEVRKVRARVHRFCKGRGLDIGAETETVTTNALGIGLGKACLIQEQVTTPDHLRLFADASVDFVFSSFVLNRTPTIGPILKEWWRVLKPMGHLILYLPDRALYPRAGSPQGGAHHEQDLTSGMVLEALGHLGTFEVVVNELRDRDDEYAFELVVQKQAGMEVLRMAKPEPKKRAAVCRYGGYGDNIMALKVTRELKRLGYHVTFYTSDRGKEVAAFEPSVDELVEHTEDQVLPKDLTEYWGRMARHYDRFINLNGTMEGVLLFRGPGWRGAPADVPLDEAFALNHEERHARANVNYMEWMLGNAGMPNLEQSPPAIHFTEYEKAMAAGFRKKFQDNFMVMMPLGGSADHKLWYHAEEFSRQLLEACPEAKLLTVGDAQMQLMEWDHERVVRKCGKMPFRSSALATTVADLVISTETGLAHAAAGARTPLLVLLSHSSEENLTKHWPSAVPIRPPVGCHPCHQLHYTPTDCPTDDVPFKFWGGETRPVPICSARMTPEVVLPYVLEVYQRWKALKAEREALLKEDVRVYQEELVSA